MKKGANIIIYMFLLCMIGTSSFSAEYATAKGSQLTSGGLSYSLSSGDLYEVGGDALSTFGGSGRYGYFIEDQLAIGLVASLVNQSQGSDSINSFGFGPSCFLYLSEKKDKIKPYLLLSVMMKSSSVDISGISASASGTSLVFGGGLDFMLAEQVAFALELNYCADNLDGTSGNRIYLEYALKGFYL